MKKLFNFLFRRKKKSELDILSDKVRSGEPISIEDAIRVLEYQSKKNKA